jgi:DNA polymerase-3 subunit epsilon/exodeoxyribonuclease X
MEAKSLNIEIKAHDAIGDVLVLKLFLSKLKELIMEKYKGENPVEKMVELTKQPILIKKFRFGKYKDKTIQEVAQNDPSYLRWMLSSMDNLDDDLRYSIEYYLNS